VFNMHRWDRQKLMGERAFQWLKDDDEQLDFLKFRSMANLIAKGLHMTRMDQSGRTTKYQKTCFIFRMYKKKQVNVMWCCAICKLPLCKIDRG
jgi:hypothetical protein